MKYKRILKSKKGVTLIELIISLAIFGMLVVPLAGVFTNSMSVVKNTEKQIKINGMMRVIESELITKVTLSKDYNDIPTQAIPDLNSKGVYNGYLYNAVRQADETGFSNTYVYLVTLTTDDGKPVQQMNLRVNNF